MSDNVVWARVVWARVVWSHRAMPYGMKMAPLQGYYITCKGAFLEVEHSHGHKGYAMAGPLTELECRE